MKIGKQELTGFFPAIITAAIWATQFSVRINNPLIYVLGFYCLFIGWPYPRKINTKDFIFALPVVLFLAFAIGLIWSSDLHEGWKQLEKRLPLVVFPFIFFMVRHKFSHTDVTRILYAFLVVCLGISLVCYGNALWNIVEHQSLRVVGQPERNYYYLSYLPLTRPVGIDPIYVSLYINFSILILLFHPFKSKRLTILLLLYLICFDILVASKAGIVGLGIIFMLYFLRFIKNKVIAVSICLSIGLAFFVALKSSVILKERFVVSTQFRYDVPWAGDWNSVSQRLAIWSCAVETIEKNFPLGFGTGDGQKALNATYVEKKYIRGYEDDYNAHNEYLFTWLDTGIFGFIVLLGMVTLPFTVLKGRDGLFMIFLIVFFFYFLVEVVLNRRAGLNFFCFFYSLLALNSVICTVGQQTLNKPDEI